MELPPHKREAIAGVILPVAFIAIERSLPDQSLLVTSAFYSAASLGFVWGFWDKLRGLAVPVRRLRLRSPIYLRQEVPAEILAIRDKTLALEQQHTWFDSERQVLEAEVRRLTERETALEAVHRSLRMGMQYGESRSMPMLESGDLKAVREHVAELLDPIEKAHDGAADILSRFLSLMNATSEHNPEHWLAAFLHEVLDRAGRTFVLLKETVAAKEDPRVALVLWYGKYNWMRLWMTRLAALRGVTLPDLSDYAHWRSRDRDFFALFERKIRVERLEAVGDEVRRYRQTNNYPIDMP